MEPAKFVGPLKVEIAVENGDGTVSLTYSSGEKETMPKVAYELTATDEQKDWNYVQEKKFEVMCKEILAVITTYDLQAFEIDGLIKNLLGEINGRFDRAVNYNWTKDDTKFTPGRNPALFFKFSEALKIVDSIPKNEPAPAKAE